MRLLLVACSVSLLPVVNGQSAAAGESGDPSRHPASQEREAGRIDGRYIVVYEESVRKPAQVTEGLRDDLGFRPSHRFGHAVTGFAASLTPAKAQVLRGHPGVAFVVPDREVGVQAIVPMQPGDSAPTGVQRVEAATTTVVHEASPVNVAVIDSGIALSHPDLNAVAGKNCAGAGPPSDETGHGTHIAGTIAARNNGSGVVGVAPGPKLYAVKVVGSTGSGTVSQVVCGIDWVTSTRTDTDPGNDIAVANLSIGGLGEPVSPCSTTTDPLHMAICASTAAGVTYVVAAGNNSWDFDYPPVPDTPAAYPEVLTVTAMDDSDGLPGGTGPDLPCGSADYDDGWAIYSNYAATEAGAAHTIAAPGTCINSTWNDGGYKVISGTSMAAPHVAGVVALCLGQGDTAGPCAGLSPSQIIQKMRTTAQEHASVAPEYGFVGDPDAPKSWGYYGYLAWVETSSPGSPTAPAPSSPTPGSDPKAPMPPGSPDPKAPPRASTSVAPGTTRVLKGSARAGNAAKLAVDDGVYYRVKSRKTSPSLANWYGSFTDVPNEVTFLQVTYKGKSSRSCTQKLFIRNWTAGAWTKLDSRTVKTREVLVEKSVGATLSDYVSGTSGAGDVHLRVTCSTKAGSLLTGGDLMRVTYLGR